MHDHASALFMNRRNLLRGAGRLSLGTMTLGAGSMLPFAATRDRARAESATEPRFLLVVVLQGGWDSSYLCDARPLAMTGAGIIQNYLGQEPVQLTDRLGRSTLVTSLFQPLQPYFADGTLSIINGVHMAASFDGHEQNLNYLLAGNPFGGESFIPHLNTYGPTEMKTPLDFYQNGQFYGTTLTNTGLGVNLRPGTASSLINAAKAAGVIDNHAPLIRHINSRLSHSGAGSGRFAAGSRNMQAGLNSAADLNERFARVVLDLDTGNLDSLQNTMKVMEQFFRHGITRSALLELSHGLDTHDAASARKQPETYRAVVENLALILNTLRSTPWNEQTGTSMLQVTTVLVTSEFGRTLRQSGSPIDNTGTDHNPMSNTVLLAGRGVTGGQIIGQSDYREAGETLSPAHLTFDSRKVKTMGRPIDIDTLTVRSDLPAQYDAGHYLTFASLANSLYRCHGVESSRWWPLGRDLPAARPVPDSLLT